jgi:hypothetical protein
MVDEECGVFGGMRTGRGNRSTGIKPAPVPLGKEYVIILSRVCGDYIRRVLD